MIASVIASVIATDRDDRQVVLEQVACVTPLGLTLDESLASIQAGRRVVNQGRVSLQRETDVCRVTQLATHVVSQLDTTNVDTTLFATSKGPADDWCSPTRPWTQTIGLHTPFRADLVFSSACASGLIALIHAGLMLRAGVATRVLVVASESSFHPVFTGCFARLGVLAPPGEPCKPFDPGGTGFVVSEAAAAVVLSLKRPVEGDVVLHRSAMLSDAFHLTSHRPDGSTFRRAIREVSQGQSIDRVHAHATGTHADAIELAAVRAELGKVDVWSHKAFIGHTLGASGLLATVLSARTMPRTMHGAEAILAAGFGSPVAAVSLVRIPD